MATSLQGWVVETLLADAGVGALAQPGSVGASFVLEESELPFVHVRDREEDADWLTARAAEGKHRLRVTCWAESAQAPLLPDDPAPRNPAARLADAVEAALRAADPDVDDTTPIYLLRKKRSRALEAKRARDDVRVYRVELEYEALFEQNVA